VPSGAEILAGLAPHFVRTAAPGDETVRNASDVDRIGPLLWPPRETVPDAPRELPRRGADVEPSAPQSTTLSAATGVASRRGERRVSRWKLALATVGTTALAALATGVIAASVSSDGASALAPVPAPSASPSPSRSPSPSPALAPVPSPALAPAPSPRPSPASPNDATSPARPAADPQRDPAPATGTAQLAAPGGIVEPSPTRARTDPHALDVRPSHIDGPRATLPTVRRSSESGSAVKPASSVGTGARRPGRTTNIDPDDVSGPEE
jgi:hypothetical protein